MGGRGARLHGGSRLGGWLVLLGACAVLSGTFLSGVFVGREWSRISVVIGLAKPDVEHQSATPGPTTSSHETTRATTVRPRRDDDAPLDVPKLTFYEELTAPLSPSPARVAASDGGALAARKAERAARATTPDPAIADQRAVRDVAAASTTSEGSGARVPPRFTLQLAAYATRAQADQLCARLGTKGIVSDVSEVVTRGGTRWRVRLGTYASREEARAAAERLVRETTLEAVVMRADAAADAAR